MYKDKPFFSSYTQSYFFSLKMRKTTSRPQVTRWNIQNTAPKIMFHLFLKAVAKMCARIRWELECEKCFKTFCKIFRRQNMQNETNIKHSSNPKDKI